MVVDGADVELVGDLLWLHGATAVGERILGALVELEAGFVTADAARLAVAAMGERGVVASVVDVAPALDAALDAWMTHARPVRAGRLHVRPSWLADDDDAPQAGERVVVLDPSRAFGSGSHPSTQACLEAVDRLVGPGAAVLDVGCGSGVLAVAAALLGAATVVAVDVDPVAVAATSSNARRNGVDIVASVGSAGDVPGTFDVVLANIGAGTVLAMASELAARCAPGGRLVVAGLYANRADEVSGGFDAVGLTEEDRTIVDGWACLIHHSPPSIQHTVAAASGDDRDTEGAR